MIRKILHGKIDSITVAALLVALSSLVSRFLGIFRDRILAGEFGAGDTLDVFYAAFRVPDLLFNLIVLGALSAGFIPIFTNLIKDPIAKVKSFFSDSPNREAWELSNNILNMVILGLLALSAFGIIFAPWLTKVITPGFALSKQQLTLEFTRIMFLSPLFLGISSVFGGVLQSFKRFFVYSLSPIFYNIGIIIGALYFVPMFGLVGLAWGVVFGAFMHMLVQLPTLFSLGYKYRPIFDFKNKHMRAIGSMSLPRTLSLATGQISLLVITIIASTLSSGSLAIFNFANNLQSFPIGIFGISFAVAAFPTLAAVAFDRKKLVENFSKIIRQILFFIVPATVLLITLRAQIIRVILGTGQFDWQDTVLTVSTLGFFSLSLFAQSSIPLLVRVYYARHDSKTPFVLGLITAIANILLSIFLSRFLGVAGLALAFTAANILNFLLLWIWLRIEIGDLDENRIFVSVTKFSLSAVACGLAVQGVKLLIWPYINMTTLAGVLIQGSAAGLAGILVYIAFSSLLRTEELEYLWNSIKRRMPWKKLEPEDQVEARGI